VIVGNGLLAQSLAERYAHDPGVTIFASGVSDSGERRLTEFERERGMLQDVEYRPGSRLVYFGSCAVAGGDGQAQTPYMRHKRDMEALALSRVDGLVVRLPQAVGITSNPHTLTNYLRDKLLSGERFTLWSKAERNLVDIDHVAAIATALIDDGLPPQSLVAIAAQRSLPMAEIVAIFERVMKRRANYVVEDEGSPLAIEHRVADEVAGRLGIDLGGDYAQRVISKYYGRYAPA
jgi:nucleoside-diphosphate-sugar epimerase